MSKVQRVAVVTGGAEGIGRAHALRLANDGHKVAIADLKVAEETERLISEAGGEVFSQLCDVSDGDSVDRFRAAVEERFGVAQILVHNAGIYPMAPIEEIDLALWRRVMSVNLDSAFHLTKAFLPGMKASSWGRIVFMTSTTFNGGPPGLSAYTASKGGVIGFLRSIAAEAGVYGVTVNGLSPSLVRTPGTMSGPQADMGLFEYAASMQAIKRTSVPEDLANAMALLVSEDAAFVTGQTLLADGGMFKA